MKFLLFINYIIFNLLEIYIFFSTSILSLKIYYIGILKILVFIILQFEVLRLKFIKMKHKI